MAPSFEIKTIKTDYTAGEVIMLQFESKQKEDAILTVKNVWGTSVLLPSFENSILTFNLPSTYSNSAGICHWQLISNKKTRLSGEINIVPNIEKNTSIETYLGPRNISVDNMDHSMLVVVPTDVYDNPLGNGTPILEKHQFEGSINENSIETNNLLAWKNIKSTKKSGRILISASCNGTHSKEMTSMVFPGKASNFSISYQRNHDFADGNQIITFSTSVIKDNYGNIISDGTLVYFNITESNGTKLQAMGTTLNGIAKARLLHPDHKAEWSLVAYVIGAAKSNALTIGFKTAVSDFEMHFSRNNREIKVGPLRSFMKQLVPDGISIQLEIYDDFHSLLETKKETSQKGLGIFVLEPNFFPNGNYSVRVEVAGIVKKQTVTLK
ncbi:hypothetical protein ACKWB9_07605 [Maribacter sp. 2304DJ31-5]